MILVAGGDSFIWGSELSDSPHGGKDGYSRKTFTSLLANDMEYVCAAYPGNANNAISRMAINACQQNKDVFLFVQWTYPQRYEFRFDDRWSSINSWHTKEKQFSKSYFKYVGNNEYFELYSLFKEIVYLQNYCQINHIPYMFTTSDNSFYNHPNYERRKNSELDSLYQLINWTHWFFFNPGEKENETKQPRGFYQWAMENKYNIGVEGHPLEDAHRDAAELMRGKFNELVKKNN